MFLFGIYNANSNRLNKIREPETKFLPKKKKEDKNPCALKILAERTRPLPKLTKARELTSRLQAHRLSPRQREKVIDKA